MNPEPESQIPTPHSLPKRRRRTGKVACLPDAIRKQINTMLQNGLSYRRINEKLHEPGAPPLPHEITENNISDWKDGGYGDWLKDQFWQEEMRTRHQAFSGLLANGADAIQLPEGGLQLAAIGLCELLRDVSEASEDPKPDPDKYVRLANSLARVSRSILHLQQYRDACIRARVLVQELKDPNRKLTQKETRAIVRHVDGILGLQFMDGADTQDGKDALHRVPDPSGNENSGETENGLAAERVPTA